MYLSPWLCDERCTIRVCLVRSIHSFSSLANVSAATELAPIMMQLLAMRSPSLDSWGTGLASRWRHGGERGKQQRPLSTLPWSFPWSCEQYLPLFRACCNSSSSVSSQPCPQTQLLLRRLASLSSAPLPQASCPAPIPTTIWAGCGQEPPMGTRAMG